MSGRRQVVLLLLILFLAALLRGAWIGRQSLRVEEAFSLALSREDPTTIVERTSRDVHPPLHLILLHYWTGNDPSEADARSLSVVAGVLSVLLVFLLGRLWLSGETALWAALLGAVSPFHIWYSQETRPYALLMLAALSSLTVHVYALRRRRFHWWLFLSLLNAAGLYLHYFFATVLLFEILFTWSERSRHKGGGRRLVLSMAGSLLLFLPWLARLRHFLAGEHGWSAFDLRRWVLTPGWVFFKFVLGNVDIQVARTTPIAALVTLLLFSLAVYFGLHRLLRLPEARRFLVWYVTALFLAPFLLALPFSFALAPKYVIVAFPALLWVAAAGVSSVRKPWLRAGLMVLIVASSFFFLRNYYLNPRYARDDWRGMAAAIADGGRPGEVILFLSRLSNHESLDYYYRGDLPVRGVVDRSRVEPGAAGAWLEEELGDYQGVWFVHFFSSYWDPQDFTLRWLEKNWERRWASPVWHRGARLYHFVPRGDVGG